MNFRDDEMTKRINAIRPYRFKCRNCSVMVTIIKKDYKICINCGHKVYSREGFKKELIKKFKEEKNEIR